VIEVFQRRYDIQSNAGRSLAVDGSDNTILMARLSSTQTDSVSWQVSADGGANWEAVLPGSWQAFAFPGSDLHWRSAHYYTGWGVNPTCTHLEVEWLDQFPAIGTVVDIPNDQGRQVRITWTRSGFDHPESSSPITEYAIFRRIDPATASSARLPKSLLAMAPAVAEPSSVIEEGQDLITYPPGDWDFVKTVPAYCEHSYSTVIPTLADSTSEGVYFTAFFVRAGTATPSVYYDSPVDSGYSADNLAPAPPANLRMMSPTALAWDGSRDDDFDYFTVYGSDVPELDWTAVLLGYTIGTVMDVSGELYGYYHVTATDFAGNEGSASSVKNAYSGVAQVGDIPIAFALRPNQPNPFAGKTSIGFDLPVGCDVILKVFDAQGRQVKALAHRGYPAGRHSVVWAGNDQAGRALGSGIYFVRIEAGDFRAVSKMLLAR
jgi:hypothetical protein